METPDGIDKEIEVRIAIDDEEIKNIVIRFTLTCDSPKYVEQWGTFLTRICSIAPLRIIDHKGNVWAKERSELAIKNHPHWGDFSRGHKW